MSTWQFYLLLVCIFLSIGLNSASRFRLQNRCNGTVWAGIQGGTGHPHMKNGGIQIRSGDTIAVDAPKKWSGRFWGRQDCFFDNKGKGSCLTGDCDGLLQCGGKGWTPPVSVAHFKLDSPVDYYYVSLVDGYNLPISIIPTAGSGNNCKPIRCFSDLNIICPHDLQFVNQQGKVVACNSACQAFNLPEYCCSGSFNSSVTCKASQFSQVFKSACPNAYSYAFDNNSTTFTCKGADYFIRFC
ncbi:pathogenesis-related thaumatin-like protein 3.5 [Amaranthus tricolor]|uniref:pathogenesis-related thaumatin-like protein 3.5 n=1 Tax=Amaranthus tricolor TaxID=29722 RepID=UPI0025872F0F|nr:pathogenesis-related thaumatin-like protein 3.5 [Amaranthus tricolor]